MLQVFDHHCVCCPLVSKHIKKDDIIGYRSREDGGGEKIRRRIQEKKEIHRQRIKINPEKYKRVLKVEITGELQYV